MRLDHDVELRFLAFTQSVLGGRFPGPPGERLKPNESGLARRGGQVPVKDALIDQVGKAVVGYLARHGGMTPERYVHQGRRVRGCLLLPPLVGGVAPLGFSGASARLLVHVHDEAVGGQGAELPKPASLGDRLVFHLVARALAGSLPPALAAASPMSALLLLESGGGVDGVRRLPGSAKDALVLRALGDHAARGWCRRIVLVLGLHPEKQLAKLLDAGRVLAAWTAGMLESGRLSLALALGHAWRLLFREGLGPEEVLARAAQGAQAFRTVHDQEAYLAAVGGLFGPAVRLAAEAERIRKTPFVEREEEEKLFHDEVAAELAGPFEHAQALSRALTRKLG